MATTEPDLPPINVPAERISYKKEKIKEVTPKRRRFVRFPRANYNPACGPSTRITKISPIIEIVRNSSMHGINKPSWRVSERIFESTTRVLFPTIKAHGLIAGKTNEIKGIINISQEGSYTDYRFLPKASNSL